MTSFRTAASVMPSKPNPNQSVSGVETTAASSKPTEPVCSQSFALASVPVGGPGTVQPSIGSPSSSKDVVPSPVETSTWSTKAPRPCTAQSLVYEMETST